MKEERIRGLRSLPTGMVGIIAAGRSFEEQVADVRREGIMYTAGVLRNAVLGGLDIRRRQATADNLIVVGCACFGTLFPVLSYFRLLDRLGAEYTFLSKEYCCGAPFIMDRIAKGEDRGRGDELAREFIGLNMEEARRVGARNIYYLCVWCLYLARRFYPEGDIAHRYYLELLPPYLEGRQLHLPGRIAYFQGGQHRRFVYDPDMQQDLDWPAYRALLDRVQGLEVVDIPRYCCVIAPGAIFDRAQNHGLRTIVTPCLPCYGRLTRKAPQGMRVKSLPDLLLDALGPEEP